MALILLILLIIAVVKIWSEIFRFYHYDYREYERTGLRDRPDSKPIKFNDESPSYENDGLPYMETDDWIDDWYYDPETKSFKQK